MAPVAPARLAQHDLIRKILFSIPQLAPPIRGNAQGTAKVFVADAVKSYLVDLADATRTEPDLLLGASPRATLFMQRAARTSAATLGRDYVTPDDVKDMLHPVLNHRLILQPEAQMRGARVEGVIDSVSSRVGVPGARTTA